MAIGQPVFNSMLCLKMAVIRQFLWQPLIRKTKAPLRAQETLLKYIIEAQ